MAATSDKERKRRALPGFSSGRSIIICYVFLMLANAGSANPLHAQLIALGAPSIHRYLGGPWHMHLPFAYHLIRELKPKVFVELGVYKGESYFAFCQSVHENNL